MKISLVIVSLLFMVGCSEVKLGGADSYEIEMTGKNLKVVEFTPYNAPNMLCVVTGRSSWSTDVTCFNKEKN